MIDGSNFVPTPDSSAVETAAEEEEEEEILPSSRPSPKCKKGARLKRLRFNKELAKAIVPLKPVFEPRDGPVEPELLLNVFRNQPEVEVVKTKVLPNLSSTEVELHSKDSQRNPEKTLGNPEVNQGDPLESPICDLEQARSSVSQEDPKVKQEFSELKREDYEVKVENPSVKEENPVAKEADPEMPSQTTLEPAASKEGDKKDPAPPPQSKSLLRTFRYAIIKIPQD